MSVHYTNLDWEKKSLGNKLSFYCNCCCSEKYYQSVYMRGIGLFNMTAAILCLDCYPYISGNCGFCHPD